MTDDHPVVGLGCCDRLSDELGFVVGQVRRRGLDGVSLVLQNAKKTLSRSAAAVSGPSWSDARSAAGERTMQCSAVQRSCSLTSTTASRNLLDTSYTVTSAVASQLVSLFMVNLRVFFDLLMQAARKRQISRK